MSKRRGWSERRWDKRLLEYAYLCADEALEQDFFQECVDMLERDYDTIVAIIDYDTSGRLVSIHQSGLSDQALSAYKAHYYRTNIYSQKIQQFHLENATTNFEQHLTADEFHRSEYYNDFLRPLRVEHVLALGLRGEMEARTSVTLYRRGPGAPFDRSDIRRFDRLRPLLRGALTMRKLAADRTALASGVPSDERPAAAETAIDRVPSSRWSLTPRESEVAIALANGLTYKEVAFKLGISFHTVNDYVDSLHRKMNMSTARIIAVLNRRA